jgi:hypothetical protein
LNNGVVRRLTIPGHRHRKIEALVETCVHIRFSGVNGLVKDIGINRVSRSRQIPYRS